eukprot:408187-Hanusia_phi.AAC.1
MDYLHRSYVTKRKLDLHSLSDIHCKNLGGWSQGTEQIDSLLLYNEGCKYEIPHPQSVLESK